MFRLALASILTLAPLAAQAQQAHPGLIGRIDGNTYVSPTGAYTIDIPVNPVLGGNVFDTPFVVTFQDSFSTHISVASVPQDATERWELSTRGTKDYLKYFFNHYAFNDFLRTYKNASIESALYLPDLLDGALVVYVLLPGGSEFANLHPVLVPDAKPAVAKRGNLIFIKNGFVYIISTELAERITEGSAYSMSTEDENVLLRETLTDIVHRIRFLPAPATPDK
jgi:hypothetical protein